jgi:hypothetical protein
MRRVRFVAVEGVVSVVDREEGEVDMMEEEGIVEGTTGIIEGMIEVEMIAETEMIGMAEVIGIVEIDGRGTMMTDVGEIVMIDEKDTTGIVMTNEEEIIAINVKEIMTTDVKEIMMTGVKEIMTTGVKEIMTIDVEEIMTTDAREIEMTNEIKILIVMENATRMGTDIEIAIGKTRVPTTASPSEGESVQMDVTNDVMMITKADVPIETTTEGGAMMIEEEMTTAVGITIEDDTKMTTDVTDETKDVPVETTETETIQMTKQVINLMQKTPLQPVNLVLAIVDLLPPHHLRVPPPLLHPVVIVAIVLPHPHLPDEDRVLRHLLVQGKWIVMFPPTVLQKHSLLDGNPRLLFELVMINVVTVPLSPPLLHPVEVIHEVHIVRKSLMDRKSGYFHVS